MIFSSNNIFVTMNFFGTMYEYIETDGDQGSEHFSDEDSEPNYSVKEIDMQ